MAARTTELLAALDTKDTEITGLQAGIKALKRELAKKVATGAPRAQQPKTVVPPSSTFLRPTSGWKPKRHAPNCKCDTCQPPKKGEK